MERRGKMIDTPRRVRAQTGNESTAVEDLVRIKEQIADADRTKAQAEGRLTGLLEQLKKDFGCTTLKAAEKKLADMTAEADRLAEEIDTGVAALEEELPS